MKQKILLLSATVPPAPTGSAIIVANLARQFGPDEMIVAGEMWHGMPSVDWSEQWPPLLHIRHIWPTVRGTRLWQPYWQLLQLPYVLFRCIQLVLWHRITAVFAVGTCPQFLLVSYLTSLLTRQKFYVYFHNTYYENESGWRKRFAGWLQRRVFRRASHVFVMSEGMSEFYREHYPGLRQSALVHCFNGPIPPFVEPPRVGSPMRLFMTGNLTTSCADAAARFGQAIALCSDVHLTLLTPSGHAMLTRMGLLRPGVVCETVAGDDVLQRLTAADMVLLPHGLTGELASVEYQTIFPTRTIEYLLCGRPILAHTTAGSFITRFLIDNKCALVVDQPDVQLLCKAIERLRTDAELRSELVRNALKTAEQFQATRVAAELRRHLM